MSRPFLPLATAAVAALLLLSGCDDNNSGRAMGSLERERITLTAPASEVIQQIQVHEGDRVKAGTVLMQLDSTRASAAVDQQQALTAQARARLAELQAGARQEERASASALVDGARASLTDARQQLQRVQDLRRQNMVGQAELDSAIARRDSAAAALEQAQEQWRQLDNGTRPEQIQQAQAALSAAEAQLTASRKTLSDLTISAPLAATVDLLPWHSGDRISSGTVLVSLVSDSAPYARVYLPQNYLTSIHNGSLVQVKIDGLEQPLNGRVRHIRSQPAFTPYYALNERDRARLMYLTDIVFDGTDLQQVAALPTGRTLEVLLP
ncbi:MAG: HlyD family efflux transporter periplasmic adaptor subunit [Pseudomonadota bacterium]|nr:HlyD family efflux transporter periplasmic adaptor subunit [Pseudomonadota bacterium]